MTENDNFLWVAFGGEIKKIRMITRHKTIGTIPTLGFYCQEWGLK
jgi:hypothetical protein